MAQHRVELREPGERPRIVEVTSAVEVGRERPDPGVDGIVVSDPEVSRRHLRLSSDGATLTVQDLGSTNGTMVNGVVITGPTTVYTGDHIKAGLVELVVMTGSGEPPQVTSNAATVQAPEPPASSPVVQPTPPGPPPVAPPGPPPVVRPPPAPLLAPRPALEDLAIRSTEGAVIRYRPGTAGERAAGSVAAAARRARKRLAGLGSEPWGAEVQICLVDPYPDPDHPGELVAAGTLVDGVRGEIWMVVTPESPPEPLERPMALVFGAALPAAADLGLLLEGYGLYVAEAPNPDHELRALRLPALADAEGELASAMALSFVRYLIERSGERDFLRLLSGAQPGRIEASAQQVYGRGLAALEESWRLQLLAGEPDVKTGQFIRLAVRYLRPYSRKQIEIFVYMLLSLAFTVVFPFASKRLFDKAIPSGKFSEVTTIVAALGVAFAISLLAGLRRAYLSAYVSSAVVRTLRTQMFNRLQSLSAGWFTGRQQGDILSRLFSDVQLVEQGLSQTLRDGAFQALSLVVSAVVLVLLNAFLAVIVILGAPLVALVYRVMAQGAKKRSVAVQEQTGAVLSVATENYGAQPVVKAFGLENRERSRFSQASDRLFARELRLQLFGGVFALSVNMIVTGLQLVILGFGGWLILHHHLTLGGLVAFIGLMGQVISPVTVLTGIGQQIQASTGALVRINEILDAVPDVDDQSNARQLPPLAREIRFSGVRFAYTPERTILDGVNLEIPAGARVAFVGPTGAGKSSLLQLMMRFYDPEEGAVLFDGQDLRQVALASLRGQLGVVFQDTFLFDATIRENISLGKPGATDAEIENASHAAELHDFVMTLPRGYDTLVGERGGRLSGGQRQRLAIARALLRDPRVLLLDEATSALDPRTEALITQTLQKVAHGRTTVAVTHRLTSITDYDRIFVVSDGHIVEQGTHSELVAAAGVYASLWAEQTGGLVPAEAPFDVVGALSRVYLFAGLTPDELELVALRLRATQLNPGDTLPEGGGRLLIIRQGHARVLTRSLTGELVPAVDLGSGDSFGVAALLGRPSGLVLQASTPLSLLVLDDEALRGLVSQIPLVAAALTGKQEAAAVPAGGQRLSRMTMAFAAPPPGS